MTTLAVAEAACPCKKTLGQACAHPNCQEGIGIKERMKLFDPFWVTKAGQSVNYMIKLSINHKLPSIILRISRPPVTFSISFPGSLREDAVIAMGDAETANDMGMERTVLIKNRPRIDGDEEEAPNEEDGVHISVSAPPASLTPWRRSLRSFSEEVKRVGYLAGPMVAVSFSQCMLQVISIMMVGHLGDLTLSSTAIAVSLSSVSGFSPLVR